METLRRYRHVVAVWSHGPDGHMQELPDLPWSVLRELANHAFDETRRKIADSTPEEYLHGLVQAGECEGHEVEQALRGAKNPRPVDCAAGAAGETGAAPCDDTVAGRPFRGGGTTRGAPAGGRPPFRAQGRPDPARALQAVPQGGTPESSCAGERATCATCAAFWGVFMLTSHFATPQGATATRRRRAAAHTDLLSPRLAVRSPRSHGKAPSA